MKFTRGKVTLVAVVVSAVLLAVLTMFPPRTWLKSKKVVKKWTADISSAEIGWRGYGGAAVAMDNGTIVAWTGVRDPAKNTSEIGLFQSNGTRPVAMTCQGAGPSGALFPSLALDRLHDVLYVFGGWPGDSNGPVNELYRLPLKDPALKWELVKSPEPRPEPRNGAAMIFDQARRRLLLFGGDAGTNTNFVPLGDLWQYDVASNKWTQLHPRGRGPNARWHAAMVEDPYTRQAYLIGGAGREAPIDADLYALDLTQDWWQQISAVGSPPPSVQGASLTFDEGQHVLLLAGGLRNEGEGQATLSSAWIFDPITRQWDETPGGQVLQRRDHCGVYDMKTGAHYLFGGRISKTVGNFYERGPMPTTQVRLQVRRADAKPQTQPADSN